MAQLALTEYLSSSSKDPFGELASKISACPVTRTEGGKIGWVDLPQPPPPPRPEESVLLLSSSSPTSSLLSPSPPLAVSTTLLPIDVLHQLVQLAPKSGDVHILESSRTNQVHVVRVEELLIRHTPNLLQSDDTKQTRVVGSYSGQNKVVPRRKLKGSGIIPEFPALLSSPPHNHPEADTKQPPQKYLIQTSGCQMNVADSERLAGILEHELQLTLAESPHEANVLVVNTCSIRDHAEQKLYDILGPYCARKRNGESLALIVTGCVAQQEGEALLRRIPELDVVLGPQYIPFLKNVLESVEWGHQVVATAPMFHQEPQPQQDNKDREEASSFAKPIRGHNVRAWVNVIHGCNEHCTYCVVPATRGMEQSRTMEAILNECVGLVENGYKEVTLLGQNIDAYGRDMVPKRTFAELLEFLNTHLPDGMRIRYVTSHPRYFSDRVIDAVANLDKICECFHMPFQAGDDEVLKRMRRGYTHDSYMRIIDKIRAASPDAAICGDVIVGFPGETEEAFQKTLHLMEKVKFDNLNTFAYSTRPNTEAALWEDQVPEPTKNERLQRVQQLAMQHGLERSQRYLGQTVQVLVEDANPKNANQVMGRTRQGRQVYFDGDLETMRGELVQVRITEARTWSLMGELAD
jgi:tRNA-2-methylthio-N6-dimethylallyladenosine synthase